MQVFSIKTLVFIAVLLSSPASWANDFAASRQYQAALLISHSSILTHLAEKTELLALLKAAQHNESSLQGIILKDLNWKILKDFQHQITHNNVAKVFKHLINNKQYSFSEFILTDSFGALLASYPVTSDYWQGDESKFIMAVKNEGIYISGPNWDESSKTYSFFVSLPVYQKGKVLGVLVAGLDVSSEYMMDMSLQQLLDLKSHNLNIDN
ncbi:MAG: PDC sensor domain-containing protein [Bermanella sp.]